MCLDTNKLKIHPVGMAPFKNIYMNLKVVERSNYQEKPNILHSSMIYFSAQYSCVANDYYDFISHPSIANVLSLMGRLL